MVSFMERLEAAQAAQTVEPEDPWLAPLSRVRGKTEYFDNLERVSTRRLLDYLEVPPRNRTTGTYRRLQRVMGELGWTPVRVRDTTCGGYKEQVRGYCRDPGQGQQPDNQAATGF
jgi:hypothetical protein